jgi:hypothetical protein
VRVIIEDCVDVIKLPEKNKRAVSKTQKEIYENKREKQ